MAVGRWITLAVVATAFLALATVAVAQRDADSEDGARAPNAEEESRAAGSVETFIPPDLEWEDNPDVPGVQNAIGVGDPTGAELYTNFGKMEEGVRFPAHTHPDARITTVLSGTMYYGVGEGFDEIRPNPYPAGSVVYTPPGVPHVMWAKDGETVVQETGYGPTDLEFASDSEQ